VGKYLQNRFPVPPAPRNSTDCGFTSPITNKSYSINISLNLVKKIVCFFTVFILQFIISNLYSQPVIEEWVRRYPDTVNGWGAGNAITVDNKGYVYVTGTIVISNLMKYGTIKYSENGQVMWTRIYEGTNSGGRQPYAIAVDEKGNVFVTGYGYQTGNYFDFLTIKYDSLGNEKWVRFYDGGGHDIDQATGIETDKAGNIYVSGYASLGGHHFIYCAVKYNSEGEELWVRHYGIPNSGTQTYDMTIDENSNIYITGTDSEKVATISYDSSGNIRWFNRYPYVSTAHSIAVDNNHNTFITGEVMDTSIHGFDYLTIKYSPAGEQLWVRKYTYCNQWAVCDNYAHSVAVDKSGNVYVSGKSKNGQNHQISICVIKYSNFGDTIWIRRYDNLALGYMTCMAIDSLNNVYITTGAADSILYNNISTYFTLRYDSLGSLIWIKRYYENPYEGSTSKCIAVDVSGNVFVSGLSSSPVIWHNEDMTTIRYSQPLYGIKKIGEIIPLSFKLYQNYPNPFNPITIIKFDITSQPRTPKQEVKLIIYDVLGREIETLVKQQLNAGTYEVEWDGSNYTSGVYFYRLTTEDPSASSGLRYSETKKMVIIK
jgi:hypothetical protein